MLSEGERGRAHFPQPGCQSKALEGAASLLPVSVDFRWMDELIHEKTEEDFLTPRLTPSLPPFAERERVKHARMPAESISTFVPFMLTARYIHYDRRWW